MKPLTHDQTRGTKTFHLPFVRTNNSPATTLMVRRDENGNYRVGMSVCSLSDPFVKRVGRKIAYHRLEGKPQVFQDAAELVENITTYFLELNKKQEGIITHEVFRDLEFLENNLDEIFDRLEKNSRQMELESRSENYIDEAGGC